MPSASETNIASGLEGPPRCALVCASEEAAHALVATLTRAGYEAQTAPPDKALRTVGQLAPDVVLVELRASSAPEVDGLALAAQLRADPATHTVPLILLYHTDDEAQRRAALQLGADDYFALAAPAAELCARIEALLWRSATGRRANALNAVAVSAEIDDFMRLVDAARADIDAGAHGALALVATRADAHDATAAEHTLAAAHEFFQLNLRRLDLIAFYGPTMLVVYLPRKGPGTASNTLAQMRNEFAAAHGGQRLSVGLATFPADGREVESLIERAEETLAAARGGQAAQTAPASPLPDIDAPQPAPTWISIDTPDTELQPAATLSAEGAAQAVTQDTSAPAETKSAAHAADAPVDRRRARAVRESKQADTFLEAAVMPQTGAPYGVSQVLAHEALAAAARERERRARGAVMPRRLLLAVSDAARMAQINLLLRSAGYEVRAAFDAHQALNLLRIDRPDLLVLDFDLQGLDGLETLRRLAQQQHGRPDLPVVLLLPATTQREEWRAAAHELGARGFVNLPYEPATLLEAVRITGGRE
ncbi:MAG: response regulator [Pyrinomonadaceae bacterium]